MGDRAEISTRKRNPKPHARCTPHLLKVTMSQDPNSDAMEPNSSESLELAPRMDEADRQIDLTDLAMPIPLLRAAKVLRTMRSGELLVVAAQGGVREFAAFVRVNSLAELVFQQQGEGGQFFHFLRRF